MSKKTKLRKKQARTIPAPVDIATKNKEVSPKRSSKWDLLLRPQNIFVILAFLFGTGILLSTPPFQVPDEIAHFDRAYKLSEFATFQRTENKASGDYVPASIDSAFLLFRYLSWQPDNKVEKQKILDALKIPLENKKRKFAQIDAGPYFYLSYLPQYPAIYLGKIFKLNVLVILYLGRFFALLFYIFCVWYAIKIIPTAKFLLMSVALMPMCLAQAASSNADCVLYSFCFLALALLLKISFEKKKFSFNKESVLLFFLLISLGILKPVYVPIAFLVLMIPRLVFKNNLRYFLITGSVILVAILLTFLWLKSNSLYLSADPAITDAPAKINYLKTHPLYAFKLVDETWGYLKDMHYYQTIGVLGYLDTKMPGWVYSCITAIILFLALFESNKEHKFFIYQRILLLSVSLLVFLAIFVSIFLGNPASNGDVVFGVQGRYFIPILLPFLLTFNGLIPLRLNLSKYRFIVIILIVILFIVLLATEMTIIDRYFG